MKPDFAQSSYYLALPDERHQATVKWKKKLLAQHKNETSIASYVIATIGTPRCHAAG